MIIMPDTRQPTPVERLLDWKVAYINHQAAVEQLRPDTAPPKAERLNHSQPIHQGHP
jgi:hypothetical protein